MTSSIAETKEDRVLASIRRLVADDSAAMASGVGPVMEGGKLECLILRPDQRVDENGAPFVPGVTEAPTSGKRRSESRSPAELAATIAEFEAAVAGVAADWDPDGTERAGFPASAKSGDADLRGLVADAVRDELRGALGEQITHTVRKLVRSEVNRILEARAFEARQAGRDEV